MWRLDWPVMMVDWHGAVAYAAWAAVQTGVAWRLPHELEWEKAGRGVDGRFYPWGDGFDPSWCHMALSHDGRPQPCEVGAYSVDESVYGARDMAGNMMDWTGTVYQDDGEVSDGGRVVLQHCVPDTGSNRVSRGGGWYFPAGYARVANRYWLAPGYRFSSRGFRLARLVP